MSYSSLAERSDTRVSDLTDAFCTYCGYPPRPASRARPHRVCRRCGLGLVLHAPEDNAPAHDALFLILDEQLLVQGVSRGAESVLLVGEPEGVHVPLSEYLIPAGGDAGKIDLAGLVALAVAGTPLTAAVKLRTTGDPVISFAAQVSSCGPPPAALLLLTPLADRDTPSPTRRRAAARNGRRPNHSTHNGTNERIS